MLCSTLKLDSGTFHGTSVRLFFVSAVPSVVHEMLLTSNHLHLMVVSFL